ncbi:hypothetical protein V8E53_015796 [Lactarius tabidus]
MIVCPYPAPRLAFTVPYTTSCPHNGLGSGDDAATDNPEAYIHLRQAGKWPRLVQHDNVQILDGYAIRPERLARFFSWAEPLAQELGVQPQLRSFEHRPPTKMGCCDSPCHLRATSSMRVPPYHAVQSSSDTPTREAAARRAAL